MPLQRSSRRNCPTSTTLTKSSTTSRRRWQNATYKAHGVDAGDDLGGVFGAVAADGRAADDAIPAVRRAARAAEDASVVEDYQATIGGCAPYLFAEEA